MIRFLFASWFALTAHCQSATFHGCPPEGTFKTEEDRQLNTLKNRVTHPEAPVAIDLATVVAPGEDSKRFSNDWGVTIEGYIVAVKFESAEGCNCGSMAANARDFHMWFGLKPDAPKRECMIVEVSPRWRESKGWTPAQIKSWRGKKVRVTGWMFFDPRHASMAVNSTPDAKILARATCWEVHPVCEVEVLP